MRGWLNSTIAGAVMLLAALLAFSGSAGAAEDGDQSQGGWEFKTIPYFWLPATHGTIHVGDLSADMEIGLDDVFNLLGDGDLLGGMGRFEARKGKFTLFVDASGAVIDVETAGEIVRDHVDVDVDLDFDIAIIEMGAAYRFAEYGPFILEGLAGARYTYAYTGIQVKGADNPQSEHETTNFVDPFFGGRAAIRLAEGWSLLCRGDVGGFYAGSKLAWTAFGGVLWDTPWKVGAAGLSLFAGYKVYDLDYEAGSGDSEHRLNVQMRGPALGLLFTF